MELNRREVIAWLAAAVQLPADDIILHRGEDCLREGGQKELPVLQALVGGMVGPREVGDTTPGLSGLAIPRFPPFSACRQPMPIRRSRERFVKRTSAAKCSMTCGN